jgi:hypothetical protein
MADKSTRKAAGIRLSKGSEKPADAGNLVSKAEFIARGTAGQERKPKQLLQQLEDVFASANRTHADARPATGRSAKKPNSNLPRKRRRELLRAVDRFVEEHGRELSRGEEEEFFAELFKLPRRRPVS